MDVPLPTIINTNTGNVNYYLASFGNSTFPAANNNPSSDHSYGNPAAINLENRLVAENKISIPYKKNTADKKINWGYISGIAATLGQVLGGGLMIWASLIQKRGGGVKPSYLNKFGNWLNSRGFGIGAKIAGNPETREVFGSKINKWGWKALGASYLVSIPSCIGASLAVNQPSMLLGSIVWAAISPFMMMKKYEDSARMKGLLMIGYSLNYLGLANKIKNDGCEKTGECQNHLKFKENKDNLLSKIFKFSIDDHKKMPASVNLAFSQTKDFVSGERKETPSFLSFTPTPENRKLSSLLLYAGGIPLAIFGTKFKPLEKAANLLIGAGMLMDALGMMAIGNSEKGATKAILLGGVPLRAIGDFAQTNKFMYGLRTLGGASFEYYFADLNRTGEKKLKAF